MGRDFTHPPINDSLPCIIHVSLFLSLFSSLSTHIIMIAFWYIICDNHEFVTLGRHERVLVGMFVVVDVVVR
jgi:hypothetical protein